MRNFPRLVVALAIAALLLHLQSADQGRGLNAVYAAHSANLTTERTESVSLSIRTSRAGITTTASSRPLPSKAVHVVTFADRPTVYLNALAAAVMHFNREPLYVLGMSRLRSPARPGVRWNITRRVISGTDPGKLKKVWFLGSLLDQPHQLAFLGFAEDDLLLFVDAFDVIIQRPLHDFSHVFDELLVQRCTQHGFNDCAMATRRASLRQEAVVLLGEHSCWPWPLPGMQRTGRPRGVSMAYMEGHTFEVVRWSDRTAAAANASVTATQMCAETRRLARGGLWPHPNSGVFAGSVQATRRFFGRLQRLAMAGHFEDQAMFHLAALQHPSEAILVDSNASLFASQFAYNAAWWQRPACFADYWGPDGPPQLLATGRAPFALHFNGPAGRHRLGWCIAATIATSQSERHFYIDVDRSIAGTNASRAIVPVLQYCSPPVEASRLRHGAVPPSDKTAARLPPCEDSSMIPLECSNDRCELHRTA